MTSELLAGLDTAPCDACLDAAVLAGPAASTGFVGLVGMQLGRSASEPTSLAADRRHSIQQFVERLAVVNVGPGQQEGERDALPVGDEMSFGPGLPRSVGLGPVASPPFWRRWTSYPGKPGSSQAGLPDAGGAAARGAAGPKRLPPASPAAAASTSPRNRTPSLSDCFKSPGRKRRGRSSTIPRFKFVSEGFYQRVSARIFQRLLRTRKQVISKTAKQCRLV